MATYASVLWESSLYLRPALPSLSGSHECVFVWASVPVKTCQFVCWSTRAMSLSSWTTSKSLRSGKGGQTGKDGWNFPDVLWSMIVNHLSPCHGSTGKPHMYAKFMLCSTCLPSLTLRLTATEASTAFTNHLRTETGIGRCNQMYIGMCNIDKTIISQWFLGFFSIMIIKSHFVPWLI